MKLLASPALLAVTLVILYLPSLGAGFIGLDDNWLFRTNPFLNPPRLDGLERIWVDFSARTRLILGAEYLPVRDTASWLAVRASSLSPATLRCELLLLYVVAVLTFRSALLACVKSRAVAEVTAWLFALHPVHVESVAWLSGSKDVLSLLFVSAGLSTYARRARFYAWSVPLFLLLACLSKGVAVVAPALLLVTDLLASRKPEWRVVAVATLIALVAALVDVKVGASVGMVSAPYGGTHSATFWTMGTVSLRYLVVAVWPPALSLFHDVPVTSHASVKAALGYALLLGWGVAGLAALRRGSPSVLAAFLLWVIPLAPVSQLVFPLQNQMADRYLLLSVAAPCLLFSSACVGSARAERAYADWARWRPRAAVTFSVMAPMFALAISTFVRADVFGDEARLYLDAYRKEPGHPGAAYQIGWLLESMGQAGSAESWYRRAIATHSTQDARARAANNLARLLARRGAVAEAEEVLVATRRSFPRDPQSLGNLAEVVYQRGRGDEARRLFDELVRRFPDYAPGRRRYEAHYGARALPARRAR